ncbi:MAG: IS91 family transposase [Methyloprofundus sp.]|nr:IS91 family transposase [Methyloprofundus sp.]
MITLASVINRFEADFLKDFQTRLHPNQISALHAMKRCRTQHSPVMQVNCADCDYQTFVPHSCGHRNCPHCQHHESQQWIERQVQRQVPADYFMNTFTLPAQLRPWARLHPRLLYSMMFDCAWATLQSFSKNDKQLQGDPGAIAVLHTHSRKLNYHPHIHLVMPAATVDKTNKLWRTKQSKYLFNHKALAKVFRAKMLTRMTEEQLPFPATIPKKWVVDCKFVGAGDKALIYLGRYLYRGVIREKDILSCQDGHVTYRYQDSKTKRYKTKTVSGADFLWRVFQHVLPKGFRRARNFGFLHPNSKGVIKLIHCLLKFDPTKILLILKPRPQLSCQCCGGAMIVGRRRIPRVEMMSQPVPT